MSKADPIISALRTGHETLVALVADLDDDALAGPSAASEWDVSQVLSHLGSGAEITRATLQAALDGRPAPGHDFNPTVWDLWNAMTGRERADNFPAANQAVVEQFEAMDEETRENLSIDLGFLPAPVDVATAATMRLNEFALHSWDVRVAFDPAATVAPEAAGPLMQGVAGMLGWVGKADRIGDKRAVIAVTTTAPASVFTLRLGEQISVESGAADDQDGTLALPAEAWLRLVTGRLAPQFTPEGISTTGTADLEVLRTVFPGF